MIKHKYILFLFLTVVFAFSCKNPTADIKLKPPTNPASLSEDEIYAPEGEDIAEGYHLPDGYSIPKAGELNAPIASDSGKNFNERTENKTFYGKYQTDEWKFVFYKLSEKEGKAEYKVKFILNDKLHETYTFEEPQKDNGKAGFKKDVGVYFGFKLSADGSYIQRTKKSFVSTSSIDFDNAEYAFKAYLVNAPPADTLFQNAEKMKVYGRKTGDNTLHIYMFSSDGSKITYETTKIVDGEVQYTIEEKVFTYLSEIDKANAVYKDGDKEIKINIDGTKMFFDYGDGNEFVEVGDTTFLGIDTHFFNLLKEGGIYRVRPKGSDGSYGDTLYEYEVENNGYIIIYREKKYPYSLSDVTFTTYKLKNKDGEYSAIYYDIDDKSKTMKFIVSDDGTTLTPYEKPSGVKNADDPGYIPPVTFAGTVRGKVYKNMGEDLILHEYIFSSIDGETLTLKNDGKEIKSYTLSSEKDATEALYANTTFKLGREGKDLLNSEGKVIASTDFAVDNIKFGKEAKNQKFIYNSSEYSQFEGEYGYKTLKFEGSATVYNPGTYTFVRFSKYDGEAIYVKDGIYYRFKIENNKLYRSMWGLTVTTPEIAEDYGWDLRNFGTKNGESGDVLRFGEIVAGKTYRKREGDTFYKYTFDLDARGLTYESGSSPNNITKIRKYTFKNETTLTSTVYLDGSSEINFSLDDSGNTLNQDGAYAGKLGYTDTSLTFTDVVANATFSGSGKFVFSGEDGYKTINISDTSLHNRKYEFVRFETQDIHRKAVYKSEVTVGVWWHYALELEVVGENVKMKLSVGNPFSKEWSGLGSWSGNNPTREE